MPNDPCFPTVVVGVDGASGGQDALHLVRRLAPDAERLFLVSVDFSDALGPEMAGGAIRAAAERQAAEFLQEAAATRPEVDVRVVMAGSVAEGLEEEARRSHADLIIVGSSRRGPIMRVLLGDDTRAVLHRASCAVAVAPRGYAERVDGPLTAIGVGYGTDAASERAVAIARRLAPADGSLRLTQVARPTPAAANPLAAIVLDPRITNEIAEGLQDLGGFDEQNVRFGSVRGGLLELAGRVDLLVIGLHRRSAIGRLLQGNTADTLLHALPCPLLAVPELPVPASIGSPA